MNELDTNFTRNYTVLRVGAIQSPCQRVKTRQIRVFTGVSLVNWDVDSKNP